MKGGKDNMDEKQFKKLNKTIKEGFESIKNQLWWISFIVALIFIFA